MQLRDPPRRREERDTCLLAIRKNSRRRRLARSAISGSLAAWVPDFPGCSCVARRADSVIGFVEVCHVGCFAFDFRCFFNAIDGFWINVSSELMAFWENYYYYLN